LSINFFINVLKDKGFTVLNSDKILDFGCGNGDFVQESRDKGYDIVGCDLNFKIGKSVENLVPQNFLSKISMSPYRLPYEDNSFDYVFSETVFEHVQNTDETILEIHRILKSGGVSLHYFPSKYGIIESHVYVPFASVLRNIYYLKFWAMLGVKKKSQRGMSVDQVAKDNLSYLDSSTKYLSTKEIKESFSNYFSKVLFVEDRAIFHSPSRITSKCARMFPFSFLSYIYRTFKAVVVLTQK
jgi:ubiquinone/menaquinone biosynthesis C-methylase UbiE